MKVVSPPYGTEIKEVERIKVNPFSEQALYLCFPPSSIQISPCAT